MNVAAICSPKSKAMRRYVRRMLTVMVVYMVAVLAATSFVRMHHAAGMKVYFLAALPTIPVVGMLAVVGLYLREEQDEFQRVLVVRSLLWAIAGTLGVTAYADFLRSYKALVALPPFTEFVVFWIIFALAQAVQAMLNRVDGDD